MKIKDLITMLEAYDPDKEIIGTWEGITNEIDVYEAGDGRVMVDVDNNFYKQDWQIQKETKNDVYSIIR